MTKKTKKKPSLLKKLKKAYRSAQDFIVENVNPDVYTGNYMVPDYSIGIAGIDPDDLLFDDTYQYRYKKRKK